MKSGCLDATTNIETIDSDTPVLQHELSDELESSKPVIIALLLVTLGTLLNFFYIYKNCPIDLSGDEAHYWEWSRNLDLSYYSKGPLVAYIIAAGRYFFADWSNNVLGNEELAVRMPALILSFCTSIGLISLAWVTTRHKKSVLFTVLLSSTIPIMSAGAVLMTIDSPLMLTWTWGLVFAWLAIQKKSGWLHWIALSLCIAVGLLAKYNMLFIFPAIGLIILTQKPYQHWLKKPQPYVSTLLGFVGLLPILIWNMQNNWVSFRHVAGQAGVSSGSGFNILGPLQYLSGQMIILNPVWFLLLCFSFYFIIRNSKKSDFSSENTSISNCNTLAIKFLFFTSAVPFAIFFLFSFITKIQPNWPVMGVIPGAILMVLTVRHVWESGKPVKQKTLTCFVSAGLIIGLSMSIVGRRSDLLMPVYAYLARDAAPWEATPVAKYDMASRLRGWELLGEHVGSILDQQKKEGLNPVILTDHYQVASEVAFYTPGNPKVYCLQAALGNRLSQYDIWTNPIRDKEKFVGKPCIYIGAAKPELSGEIPDAEPVLVNMTRIDTVQYKIDDHVIQIWPVFSCDSFAGFNSDVQQLEIKY